MPFLTLIALISMAQESKTTAPTDPIEPPPAALSFGGFYKKCAYFEGMPIISSEKVDDRAFRVLIDRLGKMLARVPKAKVAQLVKTGLHYSIIADEEGTTDLPEYAGMRNDPNMDWNKRARGFGGSDVTSAGEENILEYANDRYVGESIYLHEFAHSLASNVFRLTDPKFDKDLRSAFDSALKRGLWDKTYSRTNPDEYWAEGVQMYFDCARRSSPPNGVHNEICNRVGLKRYDPALYRLVDRSFNHNPWRYEGKYNTTQIK